MRYLGALGRSLRATSLIIGNTVVLIVLILVVGEWWARANSPPPAAETQSITVSNQHAAYHPWSGFRNTPGFSYQVGSWTPIVINSWGWRGPEPTVARSKSVRRAMIVGDSTSFSCWQCREEASLGGALKRALELRTGEEWEVINTSVGAGFSSVSLGTLAYDGMRFQPDVVLSMNGINDMLALDEEGTNMFTTGGGLFKHSLYHRSQVVMGKVFDPRTGQIQQLGLLDQLAKKSALVELIAKSPFFAGLWVHGEPAAGGLMIPARSRWNGVYSTEHPERLDIYVKNQLAMSYLAEGSGAKFVGFLQPYFSLKHKIMGPADEKVAKDKPDLLKWMDVVFPMVRAKLEAAAREHPSFHFVDLSLMFTKEQVFLDLAHIKYETPDHSDGMEALAARMADEILRVMGDDELPNWRETHLAGTPHDWDERAYLAANPDVAVARGEFKSGYEHYRAKGFIEFRQSGFPSWNEKEYLAANPDVAALLKQKPSPFATGYEHYVKQGKADGRRHGLGLHWTEEAYLAANPDVAAAVQRGQFKSGQEHFMKVGAAENRRGGFSGWDEQGYLLANPDVRDAVVLNKQFRSGFQHFLRAGHAQNRGGNWLGLASPQ